MSAAPASSLLERWFALQLELQEASLVERRGVDVVEVPRRCALEVGDLLDLPGGVDAPNTLLRALADSSQGQWTDAPTLLRALVDTPPGEWSDAQCVALRRIDPDGLSQRELLDYVDVLERQKAHLDAGQIRALAALARRDTTGMQAVREDVACVLRIPPLAAAARLAHARVLTDLLPITLAAVDAGNLTLRHTRGLCTMAGRVEADVAAQVEAAVVPDAAESTPRALDRAVARAVLVADPAGAVVRHRRAAADRYVTVTAEVDGMAWLTAYGPATDLHTLFTRLDAATRLLPRDDARTVAQRRFDLLVDGLLTGIPTHGLPTVQGRSPQIHVTVAATTLLGSDNQPAELAGYGAIDADTARQLAADPTGTWRRIVTDPVSKQTLDYGRSTYRPPQNLLDHIVARDRTCRFPGCTTPAQRCDLDHTVPWNEGGETSADNLTALCRRHHELKTRKLWNYQRHPDGTLIWTSPTEETYRVAADPPAGQLPAPATSTPTKPRPPDPEVDEPPP